MVNILVFRTDRIGDLLLTCPAILTLKKSFKNCNITLIGSEKNSTYAKSLNIFDQVLEFPRQNILKKIKFIKNLNNKKFDYIFIFDGKQRSILSSFLINGVNKVALTPKVFFYYRFFKIKFIIDFKKNSLNEAFQNIINISKINSKIENYDFLNNKKDNKFSLNIPIKNYIHIHLDEKWLNNLYIKKYTNINPNFESFVSFLEIINQKNNVLITTGIISFDLIEKLKKNYFYKKTENIFFKKNSFNSIYLIFKPTFNDLESLLRKSKFLITCHGAITIASNSFNVNKIDIIEKSQEDFYIKFTSHLKNYYAVYRSDFIYLKEEIFDKIENI